MLFHVPLISFSLNYFYEYYMKIWDAERINAILANFKRFEAIYLP